MAKETLCLDLSTGGMMKIQGADGKVVELPVAEYLRQKKVGHQVNMFTRLLCAYVIFAVAMFFYAIMVLNMADERYMDSSEELLDRTDKLLNFGSMTFYFALVANSGRLIMSDFNELLQGRKIKIEVSSPK